MLLRNSNHFVFYSFKLPQKHGIQHKGISNIFKKHKMTITRIYGQATDWLSEERRKVYKDNGLVSL